MLTFPSDMITIFERRVHDKKNKCNNTDNSSGQGRGSECPLSTELYVLELPDRQIRFCSS